MKEPDRKSLEELTQEILRAMNKADEQIKSVAEALKNIPPEHWRRDRRTLDFPLGVLDAMYAYNRGEINFEQARLRFLDAVVAPLDN